MRKTQSSNWILVAGFLVAGVVNLVFNPFAIQITQAQTGCDPNTEPCCDCGCDANCEYDAWVCPP